MPSATPMYALQTNGSDQAYTQLTLGQYRKIQGHVHLPSLYLRQSKRLSSQSMRRISHTSINMLIYTLSVYECYVALSKEQAKKKWNEVAGNPTFVPRVLDVLKGQLCFVIGTVYMDMPLKPNVLDDIARDHSIPAPPPPKKYNSPDDTITLEDESGRICLVGDRIQRAGLVTGVIVGALGLETNNGDFEVVDYVFAGLAPQLASSWEDSKSEADMDVDESIGAASSDQWIALVSGLEVGAPSPTDCELELLSEFLTSELGGPSEQASASQISRLIIAGNSLATAVGNTNGINEEVDKKARRYGQESAAFSPHPTINLGHHLLDIARSMPIHLLPGDLDPSGTILPQQALPRAMFGGASSYSSFKTETNPTYIHIASEPVTSTSVESKNGASSSKAEVPERRRTLLVNSGQPLNDMFKYLDTPPHSRLSMAASTLHWRHMAPTAPDTLWCHPYFTADPFILTETPDLYIIGNQPAFGTQLVTDAQTKCRVILVPVFRKTGTVVLVNLRTLDVKTVSFATENMGAALNDDL
ncbi:hypothetical protein QCA50_002790 [Cerrena zonata]|uniref:DNA-directed DNA polymerase n=1 Tax=Cerrena zonata TaxID=2478898 RepID=A0AAW0GN04_9APHY